LKEDRQECPAQSIKNNPKQVVQTNRLLYVQGADFRILLPVFKIAVHALKYANAKIDRSRWVEAIGVLAGKFNESENTLYVEDAYPMGHGNAIYAQIKDNARYMEAYKAPLKKRPFNLRVVHSHPHMVYSSGQEDFATQARYQQLWPRSLALVIDPYMINGREIGFGLYRQICAPKCGMACIPVTEKWNPV